MKWPFASASEFIEPRCVTLTKWQQNELEAAIQYAWQLTKVDVCPQLREKVLDSYWF